MAHLEPFGMDALDKMINGLNHLATDIDEVAATCVKEGTPVMEKIYRNTMSGAHQSLGKAAASVNSTAPKSNALGVYAVSRAVGWNPTTRSHQYPSFNEWEAQHRSRYAMIAALFNYGVGPHKVDFSATNAWGNSTFVAHGVAMHPGMKVGGKGWQARSAAAAEGPVSQVVARKFDEEVKRIVQ